MRLRAEEKAAFVSVLSPYAKGRKCALYLFGSRTSDRLRGGDIDLLLLAPPAVVARIKYSKHVILSRFKKALGERRIDLTVAEPGRAREDPFLRSVLKTAAIIKRWTGSLSNQ